MSQAPRTRVLVVDDEEQVRSVLTRFLARTHEAVAAADGAQALACLAQGRFDAVLCDIRMPGITGVELIPQLIAQDPDLAIIMLTGVGEPASAVECLKAGAADYLIKPVELDELALALEYALRKRQLEIERRGLEAWLAREVAEKTRLLEEQSGQVESLAISVLMALVDALEPPDPQGRTHSVRVANIATYIAAELGLPPDEVEMVQTAARLHDIGRVALRDDRMRRVSVAAAGASARDRDAPGIAAGILAPLTRSDAVTQLVALQHERWDGTGRPAGLAGAAIPLGARIIAAGNLWDELTSGDGVRAGVPPAQAMAALRPHAGSMLDPAVVAALERVMEKRVRS